MNVEQRKWILKKAVEIINEYGNLELLSKDDYVKLCDKVHDIAKASKYNRQCVELLNSIVACFDWKEQEKK